MDKLECDPVHHTERWIGAFAEWLKYSLSLLDSIVSSLSQYLRKIYSVNVPDIIELKKELNEQVNDLLNGKLPLNKAEDIATELTRKYTKILANLTADIKKYLEMRNEFIKTELESCMKTRCEIHNENMEFLIAGIKHDYPDRAFIHTDLTEKDISQGEIQKAIREDPVLEMLETMQNHLVEYNEIIFKFNELVQGSIYNSDGSWLRKKRESHGQKKPCESPPTDGAVAQGEADKPPVAKKELPNNDTLEKIADENEKLLRRWNDGQFKCSNLRQLINDFAERTGKNPTKKLIDDYLINEKSGKPFSPNTINVTLNSYGVAPERKRAKRRHRKAKSLSIQR